MDDKSGSKGSHCQQGTLGPTLTRSLYSRGFQAALQLCMFTTHGEWPNVKQLGYFTLAILISSISPRSDGNDVKTRPYPVPDAEAKTSPSLPPKGTHLLEFRMICLASAGGLCGRWVMLTQWFITCTFKVKPPAKPSGGHSRASYRRSQDRILGDA